MAWAPVIEVGDIVTTPEGVGDVLRISEAQGTAQVSIAGKLFEIPLAQLNKAKFPEREPKSPPAPEKIKAVEADKIKQGDRVQKRQSPSTTGQVTDVTQRTVRVKWDANGKMAHYEKRNVREHLDYEQKPEHDAKVGDEVRVTKRYGGAPQVGDVGTITEIHGSTARVDFPSQLGWTGVLGEHLELVKKEQPKPAEQQPDNPVSGDVAEKLYGILELQKHLEKKIDESVDGELKDLREKIKQAQKLEVKIGDKVNVVEGFKHKQLEQLITYAMMRLHPLLVGMAGTGKTHAGEQTARALGLPFFSMSVGAQTSKSDIIGYMDASGRYVQTHFRTAYEKGGVFLMDEIDAGNANVLIQINAALSNGLCAFPDAMVTRHEDFVFIASANTFGNGANRQYVGRNQLDAATLDRFALIEWFIDDELESNLAVGLNGKAWYMAVRAARDYVAEKNIRALISPRATQKGSKLLDVGQSLHEVIHATMLGSVPDDKKADVQQVATTIFEKFASEVPSKLSKDVNPEASVKELLR